MHAGLLRGHREVFGQVRRPHPSCRRRAEVRNVEVARLIALAFWRSPMSFVEYKPQRRRRMMGMLLGILLVVAMMPASPAAVDNPIVVENQQPRSNGWMW